MKILAVLRASTIKQELDSQKMELEKFCQSKGFDEIEWLAVKGASARKANSEYLQLLEDIKSTIINKNIKYVAFWSLDRLGRIESYLMLMKEWFTKNAIQVYVNNPSLTLLNEDGTPNAGASIAWSVFASIVAFQTEEMMRQMKRTRDRNATYNKFNGGLDVKVGYVLNDERYVVVDEEDEGYKLVQLIFNEYATGKFSEISLTKELSERGITKPNGKPLDSRFIHKVLSDESYIGGHSKGVVTDRTYIPIISEVIWNKCQEIKKGNISGDITKQVKHISFATKIAKCPCCGSNMTADKTHYRCFRTYKKDPTITKCENKVNTKIEILDGILWKIASMLHIDYITDIKATDKEKFQEDLVILRQKIEEKQRILKSVPNQKMRVQEGYENGIYTQTEYKNKLSQIDEKYKDIQTTINNYKAQENQIKDYIKGTDDIDAEIERFIDIANSVFEEEDLEEMNKIVHQHIELVIIKKVENKQHIYIKTKKGGEWNLMFQPNAKKEPKLVHIHPNGKVVPFEIDIIKK